MGINGAIQPYSSEMAVTPPHPEDANRLALGFIDLHGGSYDEALARLAAFSVVIRAGESIRYSAALQAALLTAVNTAKRCFHGVTVEMPEGVTPKVLWPEADLNAAVTRLLDGVPPAAENCSVISIGISVDKTWQVQCDGWRAAVGFRSVPTFGGNDFPLGGVMGGALAVHHAFVDATALDETLKWKTDGISLWRPDLPFGACSGGPAISYLPDKIWMLGLGHLGQAYTWTMGLFPFRESTCQIMVQDIDTVSQANFGTGLLTTLADVDKRKTRILERWLLDRGFDVLISDRFFDEHTRRSESEAPVALCGFHDGKSRRLLDHAGFELVVESGLGSEITDFDQISVHTLPNSSFTAEQNWAVDSSPRQRIERVQNLGGQCGAVVLGEKAVSTSFVGAAASAFVWAEVLRQYHKGRSFSRVNFDLRDLKSIPCLQETEEAPSTKIAQRGFTTVSSP